VKKKLPRQFSKEGRGKLIKFTPNSENVKQAFERSQNLGVLPNSFTRGAGRMTGFLGEIAFELLFPDSKYVGNYSRTHDYLMGSRKIDVKSKTCRDKPKPHFTASVVCPESKPLKASHYFFVRVRKDLTRAWMLGWITKNRLLEQGEFKRKGDEDEYGFTYKVSGWHIPISSLRAPLSL